MQNMQIIFMPSARDKLVEQLCEVFKNNRSTQQQIASATGVHQSQVSRILRGHFRTVTPNVAKLCKYANITPQMKTTKNSISEELNRELVRLLDGTAKREQTVLRLLKAICDL
jgi:transcriptional regulator with XRE-family HTH domain